MASSVASINEYQRDFSLLMEEIQTCEDKVRALYEKTEGQKRDYQVWSDVQTSHEESIAHLNKIIGSLRKQQKEFSKGVSRLQGKLERRKEESISLAQTKASLAEELGKQDEEVDTLKEQWSLLKKEAEKLQSAYAEGCRKIESLQQTVEFNQTQINENLSAIESLEQEIEIEAQELKLLETKNKQTDEQINTLLGWYDWGVIALPTIRQYRMEQFYTAQTK